MRPTDLILFAFFFTYFQLSYAQTPYLNPVFEDIEVNTYEYIEKDGQSLKLDFYQPKGDRKKKRPLLVWIHGGGFSGGQRDNPDEVKFMTLMAKKGYAAASISYRLLRKGTSSGFGCDCPSEEKIRVFREAAADFMDAVLFLKKNQEQFRIDPTRIIIGGSSAGAETVLTAAFMRDKLFAGESAYLDLDFSAVISLAGAMVDVRYLTKENAIPGIFFHGTKDNLVPYATDPHHFCAPDKAGYLWLDGSQTIVKKLSKLKESYLFYTFVGAKHEISSIPFEKMDLIARFLKDVVIDEKYRTLNSEEK